MNTSYPRCVLAQQYSVLVISVSSKVTICIVDPFCQNKQGVETSARNSPCTTGNGNPLEMAVHSMRCSGLFHESYMTTPPPARASPVRTRSLTSIFDSTGRDTESHKRHKARSVVKISAPACRTGGLSADQPASHGSLQL